MHCMQRLVSLLREQRAADAEEPLPGARLIRAVTWPCANLAGAEDLE